jgi:hypothetical protein
MANVDKLAVDLVEEAKRFYERAVQQTNRQGKTAYVHAALVLSVAALEAHVNSIAEDFLGRPEFSTLERSLLAEREFTLNNGEFKVTDRLRMYRLGDRIEFLYRRFSGKPIDKRQLWWSRLQSALNSRNQLSHPKEAGTFTVNMAKDSLSAVIATIDQLYRAVYKKPYPGFRRRLDSAFDF